MENNQFESKINDEFVKNFNKIFHFWPIFLGSIIFFILGSFIYLRYANYIYRSVAVIEIVDKAQDSEMALPTAMTVFNRSMINLQNEFGRLNSYDLNKQIVSSIKSNIVYFSNGLVKSRLIHRSELFKDYDIKFKIDTDKIEKKSSYSIVIENNKMEINNFDSSGNLQATENFDGLSTDYKPHSLPFELKIQEIGEFTEKIEREIVFLPFKSAVNQWISRVNVEQYSISSRIQGFSQGSDQIKLICDYPNKILADEYLELLIATFDNDGIIERQLEYKRTIEFVETRSEFLKKEVQVIEKNKEDFKKNQNFNDIESNASLSISKQYDYDNELFSLQSQRDLVLILVEEIENSKYKLLPANFGLENTSLNDLISQYNTLIKDRLRYISFGAGENNSILTNIDNQLDNIFLNINESIEKFLQSINISIENLILKEKEFEDYYSEIPTNERILREIDRELLVKEALYSLLLQKREEASINMAVVKPTIKVIDSPRSYEKYISPNKFNVYFASTIVGILIPFTIISLWFLFDNKIHNKEDLLSLDISLLGEIPFLKEINKNSGNLNINNIKSSSRSPLVESIRILVANLAFINFEKKEDNGKVILVTSSIKGEGKTLISTGVSKILSFSSKVILIGSDLRNPQIHKYTGLNKNEVKGISDYIFRDDLKWKDTVQKSGNLDFIVSGTIPPNPTELLASEKFMNLIKEIKNQYDYVIIDSAPTLLVADTLQFSKIVDLTLYAVRANHSTKSLLAYIKTLKESEKFNQIGLVLNSVGSRSMYGYNYSYEYGYKYGYNYGYGYGYNEDSKA